MEPLVSVIIPTRNWAKYLEKCLSSVRHQSYGNIEIIVDDNNSEDDTKAIAERYGSRVFDFLGERCAQRNHGARQARGEYLFVIDGDMELSKDVVKHCMEAMGNNSDLKAVIVPEESFGEDFWAQCKKMERSYYIGLDWMEAARFFDRRAFEAVGGYNEALVGGDDYDLSQRIVKRYGKLAIGRIHDLIYHDERRLSLINSCRKKFIYGKTIHKYREVWANKNNYRKQASVLKRYGLFFSRPDVVFNNPKVFLGMLFMKTCEFVAGGVGFVLGAIRK